MFTDGCSFVRDIRHKAWIPDDFVPDNLKPMVLNFFTAVSYAFP